MHRPFVIALFLLLAPWGNNPAAAQDFPGVNDARYVSPQFGYALSWDGPWRVERSVSRPGFDALVVSNGTSDVVLVATTGFAGASGFIATPEQCARASLDALPAQPGTQPEPREDADGPPRQAGDDDIFWMEVDYTTPDAMSMTAYVSCRDLGLGNGAMQTFIHQAPAGDYASEVVAVDALLEGYAAPRLDLDRLDQGARLEPAP